MEDNPILWKSIVPFCMCLDMVSYSVPLGSDSAQFHHYKPVQKQHVHQFTATRCSKAPSVAEIAFVILKQMTYFLSKSMAVS